MGEIILEARNISKNFGGIRALRNVSLNIHKDEIVGMIGPNGAGKTTLFNIITGTYPPSSGEVFFRGMKITGLKPFQICKLGIARTFQHPKPFPNMTVYDNLRLSAIFGRKDTNPTDTEHEINHLLEQFGLARKKKVPARDLTFFEQRLLEVLRAVIMKPQLVLLDEVFAGLNPAEVKQMATNILQLKDSQKLTIFMIEHVMSAVMNMAERIIVLCAGEKIAEGTPQEIGRNQKVIEAYLGEVYA